MFSSQYSSISPKSSTKLSKEPLVIHYKINFKNVCLFAVIIPLVALILCALTACIFQFEDVHETHCKVFNIVPSISAVTGVSPQKYFWRISIAIHLGPRVIISAVYHAYQSNKINSSAREDSTSMARFWLNTAYFLNLIEAAALCGVTYISNRENYPIHEKLFIMFMVSSLTQMLASIKGTRIVAEIRKDLESVKEKLEYRENLLVLSLLSTAGLLIFFLQHRFFCIKMAFSIFALCEYVIAGANIAFHISLIKDFPTEDLMVGKIMETASLDRFDDGTGDSNIVPSKKVE